MDFKAMFRYVCFFMVLRLVGANDSYSDWLSSSRRAAKRERRTHRNNNIAESGDSFITTGKSKDCCKNGGICIMNSFCHCKKKFYGRYCEHRVKHRSCGTIAHGTWLTAACNLCHCFDGHMICKTADFPNCGDTFKDGFEKDPDYSGGIEKAFEDYDKFYDDYEETSTNGALKYSSLHLSQWLTLVVASLVYKGFFS